MKKYLFPALVIALTFMAIMAFIQAKPTQKAPIYKKVQKYSPYYLDKRFGGLQIMSKTDKNFKEKPTNMEVFHRLEFLEKEWGKSHLKVENQKLIVLDNNKSQIANINLSSDEDKKFIHSFYGI